jgi:hypothetical protein
MAPSLRMTALKFMGRIIVAPTENVIGELARGQSCAT